MRKQKVRDDRSGWDWFPFFGGRSYALRNPQVIIPEDASPGTKRYLKKLERKMYIRTSYLAAYNGLILSAPPIVAVIIGLEKFVF